MTRNETATPVALLHDLLTLDESTGALTWKSRDARHFNATAGRTSEHAAANWNSRYASTPALACVDASGHLHGRIGDRIIFAHRAVFAMAHGRWPDNEVDHVNGIPADNRPGNLRDVPHLHNLRNMKRSRANTSGVTGVSFNKRRGQWVAHITVEGRARHLGFHDEMAQAVAARLAAADAFGFHPNHGRTA